MRTTVDIPDTKYRLLKSRAASEGTTVKAMVMRGVDVVISHVPWKPASAHFTRSPSASPKDWADSYLAAFAHEIGAKLITFDKALAARSKEAIVL